MNTLMFAVTQVGGNSVTPGVLLLVLALITWVIVVGGIVFLVVWLVRRGNAKTPAIPLVQPQPTPPKPTPSTCPRCGTALPADSPQGLCPRCVLGVGLATQTEATGEYGPHGTKVTKTPPSPADIAKNFPQLEILDCLGRGGMGVVYKARQAKLNRLVALKILAPEKGADPKFAERFLREAQALARLGHPNIVTVHDFGEADGMFYLLMEFVDGATLRQLLREGRMKPETALTIVPKICEALQFAHEQGVVHRDIKPENVLLDKQGRVKIADFGIAKIVGAEGGASVPASRLVSSLAPPDDKGAHGVTRPTVHLTQDQILGTPHYMAPEQVEHPQTVDHRADIYSLGVVFYEMLTGELPLGKFQPPSKKVQVDVRLDEVVLHALEKEPERRYQHVSEVKSDVETIATTPGSAGVPPAGFGVAPNPSSNKWANEPSGATPDGARGTRALPIAELERARQEVKTPASWLVATGILNWIAIPLIVMVILPSASRSGSAATPALFALVAALFLSSAIILAGLKMKRLEAYSLAIMGSILAIIITPGNIIGLPVGIWCLVALCRRDVREAFAKARMLPPESALGRRSGAWKVAMAILIPSAIAVVALVAVNVLTHFREVRFAATDYGREVERSLSFFDSNADDRFLDIDQNRIVRAPSSFDSLSGDWSRERKHEWLRQNGIDLMVSGSTLQTPWHLLSPVDNPIKLFKVPANSWEQGVGLEAIESKPVTAEALQFMQPNVELLQMRLKDGRPADPENTFAFETANGTRGLLRISGLKLAGNEVQGVKIRYKRVNQNNYANERAAIIASSGQRNVTKAPRGRYEVKLPNGVEVKVVAVAGSPRLTNFWWQPDGRILTNAPADRLQFTGDLPADRARPENEVALLVQHSLPSQMMRSIRMKAQPEDELPIVQHEYFPWVAWSSGAAFLYQNGVMLPEAAQLVAFRELPETIAYHCGVSIGPWERVAEFAGKSEVRASLAVPQNIDRENFHIRVVAHSRDGKTKTLNVDKADTRDGSITYRVSTNDFPNLEKVTLERRRCYWAEIADISLRPRTAMLEARGFGPVIERVVNDDGAKSNFFIDLDNGKLFSPPQGLNFSDTNAFAVWLRNNGIDAMGETSVSIHGLVGMEMIVLPLAGPLWESLKPQDALANEVLQQGTPGTPLFLSAKGNLPETFLFKTREGGVGVLQITGFTENPRGVKIRYKLVQSSEAPTAKENPPAPSASTVELTPSQKAQANDMRQVLIAATMYADNHQGSWPEEISELRRYLSESLAKSAANSLEYRQPVLRETATTTNVPMPSQTPVLFEKTPASAEGQWIGFADGHVEFVKDGARLQKLRVALPDAERAAGYFIK